MLTSDRVLPPVHEGLGSRLLSENFAVAWDNSDHDHRFALFLALIKCIRWEIAKVAVPRLCLLIFNMAQPFLLSRAVVYFGSTDSGLSQNTGDLIRDFIIVLIGTAISTATYEHLGYRAMAMLRSGTTALIYRTMMWLRIDNARTFDAISLVGSDIHSVAEFFRRTICDTWANALQLGLAIWLLADQIGAICIAPIIVTIKGSVSHHQKLWLEASQKRVDFTTKVLESVKSIKMLGLIEGMVHMIEELRTEEIEISKRFQKIQAAKAFFGRLEGSSAFSVSQAITSLSLINLLLTPLRDLLFAIPDTFLSIECLDRVQNFLTHEPQNDKRMIGMTSSGLTTSTQSSVPLPIDPENASPRLRTAVLELDNVMFGTGPDQSKHIGRLTLRLSTPSLTMIVGPMGCGKSMLLKTLLGEIEPVEGDIFISDPDVAYCDQSPWIFNSSIKENIIGESHFYDGEWYRSIINACCLDKDLREMPAGHDTLIGSQGTRLSRGQMQRIAIARAVYARKPLAIFDDVLSGFDPVTERKVFDRVFSERGILRRIGCIVLLASRSVHNLPETDFVIALGADGLEMGTFRELRSARGYISKLDLSKGPQNSCEESIETDKTTMKRKTKRSGAYIEDQNREINDLAICKYYAAAIGWPKMALLLGILTMESLFGVLRYVWVPLWSEIEDGISNSRLGFWLGIYASIGFTEAAGLILAILDVDCDSAGYVEDPPRGYFTSSRDTGDLVKRFSEDIELIDKDLPFLSNIYLVESTVLTYAYLELFAAIAQAGVAIAAVPYLAVTMPFLLVILIFIHHVFSRTSRQLRLLKTKTEVSLVSHFIDSFDGLITIRTALVVLLMGLAITLELQVDPGLLGAGLLMMTMLGQSLSGLILRWTSTAPSLEAIARIKHFVEDTPNELKHSYAIDTEYDWPALGAIEFKDVCVRQESTFNLALRNITFTLQPGQKLGLCGRTGGQVLFLIALTSGQILIDSQDISTLPPSLVRKRINYLTREPFLIPASVRQNLDPLGDKCDGEIIIALERAKLWGVLVEISLTTNFPDCNPLDIIVDDSFLSYGQRQLLCLARILLKESTILLLDEPPSNLDPELDSEIQDVLQSEFSSCTIIMIADKLQAILDFDYVAVIDEGQLVELGNPRTLLSEDQSTFRELYLAETRRSRKTRRVV
ncbi:P-loop containing nucleoside triphosphate hydrolase protein [Aspergillus pseudonomiae]|uniref:P-loop containing nucleoside triphosphate hydrolase protein n=1 Tax=Aspergillus pseudonomiae TaxID=1506151 RepID=A0A5N7D761_9EURO|nr:P-loop containing nucleoside triphosphate hydrolase protein [Aspergillus pseudonomiae]KAE8401753.1 P-loop containing nucleoside triphosphate hydrolase protein [Aspergillus pseudonomiae]